MVARSDNVPIDMREESRYVAVTILVIKRPRMIGDVAHQQRISTDPTAGVGVSYGDIVPAIIIGIIHQRGPFVGDSRTRDEIFAPIVERTHVLDDVRRDVTRRRDERRREIAEIELVEQHRVASLYLSTAEGCIISGMGGIPWRARESLVRSEQLRECFTINRIVTGGLIGGEKSASLGIWRRCDRSRLESRLALEKAFEGKAGFLGRLSAYLIEDSARHYHKASQAGDAQKIPSAP